MTLAHLPFLQDLATTDNTTRPSDLGIIQVSAWAQKHFLQAFRALLLVCISNIHPGGYLSLYSMDTIALLARGRLSILKAQQHLLILALHIAFIRVRTSCHPQPFRPPERRLDLKSRTIRRVARPSRLILYSHQIR